MTHNKMSTFHTYQEIDIASLDSEGSVVGIGNFDGVHQGHLALINAVVKKSLETGLNASILTFDPHPLRFFKGARGPLQLYSSQDRESLLAQLGIQVVLTQQFDLSFGSLSPQAFVEEVLVKSLRAAHVVVGYDFAFGAQRAGTHQDLLRLSQDHGFHVEVIEAQRSIGEGEDRPFSSTWIRELVSSGEVERAAEALGRPYHVRGDVIRGLQRGRSLGFPTANLHLSSELCPAPGVYGGWLDWGSGPQKSVISIGNNPTFNDAHIPDNHQRWSVEVHVLQPDFPREVELYGRGVTLWFSGRLREMIRFSNIEQLIEQITQDCQHARMSLKTAPSFFVSER